MAAASRPDSRWRPRGAWTRSHAAATGDRPQPYAELGLTGDEYQRIRRLLGRRPTDCELAIYSVMWSEHCSYKSSRVHLRQFADKAPPSDALLAGIGQNAGVVDIGQGYAVTFKIESHNHPSYVEPFQGAATGVGGIVRDILAMGARPVAVMDALRFGPADAPDTARVLPGVVGGISFYGNCLGLPNIGGELVFDPCYAGNPLVNALCVGVMRHEDLQLAAARGEGNKVILFGSGTGPDGIGGASVLASASFGGGESAKRPSVQVGDPFMEKLLVECCLELYAAGLVAGIQDLGAAGISCATAELAAGGGSRHADRPGRRAAARPRARAGRDPDERVAGTHDGRRGARRRRRVPGHLRPLGGAGHGHRRGDRHRPARDDLARRAGGGHRAGDRRRPGPGVRPPRRPPGRPGRAGRRRPGRAAAAADGRGAARRAAVPARLAVAGRQDLGHPAVRPARARRHGARDAGGRGRDPGRRTRPASGWRWPPTATGGTACSTRTRARSSRWPRRTGTWRPPAPARSPSPTA